MVGVVSDDFSPTRIEVLLYEKQVY